MNGLPGRKMQDIESSFPGCLGTIINLFDLGTAVGGNMLLTDKPHLESSPLSRSRSDVARRRSPSYETHTEEKYIVSELRKSSSNKINGTPMKKLLAREMSKEVDHRQTPTNVVAKLMGLDTLPQRQSDAAAQQSKRIGYCSQCYSSVGAQKYHQCNKYKDVYEIRQHSTNYSKDDSPKKGTGDVNINEKHMALVRQKFMEAKRLVTDEKYHQSKEFQDALEVLSSNKDLFVKFLQESNSFFSQHLGDFQPVSSLPDTTRITVLRPSRMVDTENLVEHGKRNNKHVKNSDTVTQGAGLGKANSEYSSFVNRRAEELPTQPTRIVVLKPNPVNALDVKPVTSSSPSSPRIWHHGKYFDEAEDVESREAREIAKELTREMRETLTGNGRDETVLSSFLSNGYIGDDSSFHQSENEYVEGNSDCEIMSPSSRHSWDCINRFDSPYSSSSFGRASFSPESSVCREAKKRLSERWAMVSSNGTFQPQKHVPKSSSTLGEMLALSDIKNLTIPQDGSNKGELEARASTSFLSSGTNQEESSSNSPKSLLRSKSVPVSATSSGTRLSVEAAASEATQSQVPSELTVSKSMKSSWKVTSLFSFRNKKATKEKSSGSCPSSDSQVATLGTTPASPTNPSDNAFQCFNGVGPEERLSPDTRQLLFDHEDALSVAKPGASASQFENPNQPSPVSVLQPSFEEGDCLVADSSGLIKLRGAGTKTSLKSNLIDKSPPIGSIARTLSWDESLDDLNCSVESSSAGIEEDQDWYLFIQTLLLAAGFEGSVQPDTLLAKWHSPENPLDPSLRDKYPDMTNKELVREAKRRQHRSNRKLAFDYVNTAIMEITGYGPDQSMRGGSMGSNHLLKASLVDYLWTQLKDWFASEVNPAECDGGDTSSTVAENAVRDEIEGRGWGEIMRLEVDGFGIEIESKIMEELVDEVVIDFTGRI